MAATLNGFILCYLDISKKEYEKLQKLNKNIFTYNPNFTKKDINIYNNLKDRQDLVKYNLKHRLNLKKSKIKLVNKQRVILL